MENQQLTTQTDNTLAVIQTAPDALMLNKATVDKAVIACKGLLQRAKTEGMSDELDATINKALVKLKERYAEISDRRKPLTKLFDEIRSTFTELEAQIDPAKKGNIYDQLQTERNTWAQYKIKLQRDREEEQRKKLAADQERISLKSEAEIQLRNGFISDLSNAKKMLQDTFDSITLEDYTECAQKIFNWTEVYTIAEYNAIDISIRGIYSDKVAIENIILNARTGKFEEWAAEYKAAIRAMKVDLSEKLPGKKRELDAAEQARLNAIAAQKAAADAKNEADKKAAQEAAEKAEAEQKRLADERAAREERERIQREQEEADAILKAAREAEEKKQVEMTQSLFDNAIETAAAVEEVKAIEGYEIEVINPAGWLQIAQFWFTNEGMKMSNEEIEKKTFKQMKAFCEKWYKKNGATGLSSPYIKYNEVFKAKTGLK